MRGRTFSVSSSWRSRRGSARPVASTPRCTTPSSRRDTTAPSRRSLPDGPDVSFRAGARCGGVEIEHGTIRLERDVRLDLGGIGKGYAVDRACELLGLAGPCLVNAGGDLAVRGGAWPIAVPDGPTLELSSGALATSGRDRRRWRRGGEERHHLIDPETALPAEGPLLRVTVVAATATEAEVLAKAAFLGAEVDAPRVLVMADGTVVLAGGLA